MSNDKRWVSVEDALPTRCYPNGRPEWVLISDGDGLWGIAYYDEGQWRTISACSVGLMLANPTRFWQYVEPPKGVP
jgi:hypothetical protein